MPAPHTGGKKPAPHPPALPVRGLLRLDAWLDAHPWRTAGLLYLFALALRGLYLPEFSRSLLAQVPLLDEAFYRAEAWNIARGAPPAADAYFMTPLYPWFLSVVFRLVGDGPVGPHAVQLALGALVAPLTFALGRRALRPALALLAAAGVASFAPLVFFEPLFLVEGLVLLALGAALLAAAWRPASLLGAALAGAALGVAVLGRGSNVLLALPLGLWFAGAGARSGRRRAALRQAATFAAGCLVVLAPLLLRNAVRIGRPFFLTANAGFNLYVGNGPEANGIFVRLPGLDLAQDPLTLRFVQRRLHSAVTASQASSYWMAQTRDWVRAHPGRTLDLFAFKMLLFWNRLSIPQVEGFEATASGSRLGSFPFWRSFALFPLALLGTGLGLGGWLAARRRGARAAAAEDGERRRVLALVATCALVYGVSIAVFFVTDRYRVPAFPWLAILSAHGLASLGAAAAGGAAGRRRLLLLVAALAVCFAVTSPGRLRIDERRMRRDLGVHTALRYAEAGRFAAAIDEYQAALALDPGDAEVRDGMARLLARAGRDSLAMAQFAALLQDEPKNASAWYNLGNLYRRRGRQDEALRAYRRSLELDAEREGAWNNLGEVYRARGDTAQAAESYRRALAIVPAHAPALNNLAALRASQGDGVAAEAGFRAAVAANPRYVPALVNLAVVLTDTRRHGEALTLWRRVLVLEPGNAVAARMVRELEAGDRSGGAAPPRTPGGNP